MTWLRDLFAVVPPWRRVAADVVILVALYLVARLVSWGVDSYRHFAWQLLRNDQGVTFAIPAWRK